MISPLHLSEAKQARLRRNPQFYCFERLADGAYAAKGRDYVQFDTWWFDTDPSELPVWTNKSGTTMWLYDDGLESRIDYEQRFGVLSHHRLPQSIDESRDEPRENPNTLEEWDYDECSIHRWLLQLDPKSILSFVNFDSSISDSHLLEDYNSYRCANIPGHRKMRVLVWRSEMKRLLKTDRGGAKYHLVDERIRKGAGMGFRYVGER